MNRRAFLATVAPLALAGCGLVTTTGGVTTVNASAFAADAQLIVTGLNTVLANPTVIAGIPSASVAKVQAACRLRASSRRSLRPARQCRCRPGRRG